ncbi:hypothetical protein A3SM_11308, partial [Pseudomonas syringae pv. actinidiae ICMP 18886]
ALIPGRREVGGLTSGDMWGSVYPRSGFIHQADDYKAASVIAQRAGDVVTRSGQVHVYQPLLAQPADPQSKLRGISKLPAPCAGDRWWLRLGVMAPVFLLQAGRTNLSWQYGLSMMIKRTSTMRRAAFLTIAFMSTLTAHSALAEIPGINASSSGSVIGDDVLYSVGGGNAVTMGTAGNMDSISIGGGWNSNLVCGNMS